MAPKITRKPATPKAPAYETAEDVLHPFGLKVHDLCSTPLGVRVTILGVRYTDPEAKSGARLWARYACGLEAPLDALPDSSLVEQGYVRCSESAHVERDLTELQAEVDAFELQRSAAAAAAELAAAAEAAPATRRGAAAKQS